MTQLPPHQNPYSPQPQQAAYVEQPKNTTGTVGFVLSLVSIITCGCAAPIALLVSFIGLFKAPRGLAIAGVIISAIQTLLLVIFAVAMIAGVGTAGGVIQQSLFLGMGQVVVDQYHMQHGTMPDPNTFDQMAQQEMQNIFGTTYGGQYQYTPLSDTQAEVILPGFDGQMGTADDIRETINVSNPALGPSAPSSSPTQPTSQMQQNLNTIAEAYGVDPDASGKENAANTKDALEALSESMQQQP